MPLIKSSIEIDAPPAEVWRVLTTPELIQEWAAAYLEGISVRTTFREGEPIAWKAPDGATRACGTVTAFRPERLLRFDYADDPRGPFAEVFEIESIDDRTRLAFTTGPLPPEHANALSGAHDEAIREIKSLAEESAQIHGLR